MAGHGRDYLRNSCAIGINNDLPCQLCPVHMLYVKSSWILFAHSCIKWPPIFHIDALFTDVID